MAKDGRLTIRLAKLEPYLRKLAKREGRSLSSFIHRVLEQKVRRHFPEVAAEDPDQDAPADAELATTTN